MILWELFLGFLEVGCLAFGGAYGAIPLIRDVVLSRGWLTEEGLTHMIAVSESTPGPIMVNLATYIGSSQGGILGAAVATLAVILPAFVIILLLTALLRNVMKYRGVKAVLGGLGACVAGIVLITGLVMLWGGISPTEGAVDLRGVIITALLALAVVVWKPLTKKKMSPILLILLSAILGTVVYY